MGVSVEDRAHLSHTPLLDVIKAGERRAKRLAQRAFELWQLREEDVVSRASFVARAPCR